MPVVMSARPSRSRLAISSSAIRAKVLAAPTDAATAARRFSKARVSAAGDEFSRRVAPLAGLLQTDGRVLADGELLLLAEVAELEPPTASRPTA